MQLRIPYFITGKNSRVILMMAILFALGINGINFGFTMGQGGLHFIFSSVISIVCFWVVLRACDAIGKFFKHRFPQDRDVIPRLSLVILFYLIAILLFLVALFNLFESIPFFDYRYNRTAFAWSYFSLGILAIFLTFLREGITRYNEWQQYRLETEELHRAYTRSQLYALKSQVNPHFLFNSLNALSCLIQDDEARAEKFLDEMSKVYRYMLRHDDERLVTLETELRFLASYIHLLEARYSDSLQINISINPDDQQKWLAPLTLQRTYLHRMPLGNCTLC
jgi:signal transduction histidine kinase